MRRRDRRVIAPSFIVALGLALLALSHTVALAAEPALLRLEVTIGK